MTRKGMAGQLNMFDFYRNLETNASGEVEMVSLMPWDEEPVPVTEEEEEAKKPAPEPEKEKMAEEKQAPVTEEEEEAKKPVSEPEKEKMAEEKQAPVTEEEEEAKKPAPEPEKEKMAEEKQAPVTEEEEEAKKPVSEPAKQEDAEEEPVPVIRKKKGGVGKPENRRSDSPAMSRICVHNGQKVEVAYLNYNKVRITINDTESTVTEFTSTKEAVDYYVEKIQELEPDD